MKKEDKIQVIEQLTEKLNNAKHFYVADIGGLNAADTSSLRRKCFENNISLIIVKNTLLKIALERSNKQAEELFSSLKGETSIMLTEVSNSPAKLIKDIRRKAAKPIIKAAYVEESVYIGDQIEVLSTLKSKEELIGDVILLLQSPMKKVISQLLTGKDILAGVVKTLSEKEK